MPPVSDTVAALATPAGTAALAVVRITGPDTQRRLTEVFGRVPPARRARHADYRGREGALVDDVLVTYFAGPASFTGEDAAEISCHGNPFIAQKILEDLMARGCRPAEPGEFTRRAFLNGRIDLSQAEAVMDLIHARSERALAAANQQLRGGLGRRMKGLVERVVAVLAQIEAYIDFPDEDLPAENREALREEVARILVESNRLLATSHYGELLREGVKTVILGAPNAGKSSLLNRLVGRDRALVSPEPGTTRDFIEELVLVGGHSLRLTDTAGFNPSPAPLERLGIEKTMERALEADLLVVVVDATAPAPPSFPTELMARFATTKTVVVVNKVDLRPEAESPRLVAGAPVVRVSALTGDGLEELRDVLARSADQVGPEPEDLITLNARHALALEEARRSLAAAESKIATGDAAELAASDLRSALDALGEISGRIDNEQVLDSLFARFCIGK